MDENSGNVNDRIREVLELQSLVIHNSVHDIRAFLLAGGYAKILLQDDRGRLTSTERDYLTAIVHCTRQINDVLATLGRVAEAHDLQVERFALDGLAGDIAKLCARDAIELRIDWNLRIDRNDDAYCTLWLIGNRQILRGAIAEVLRWPLWKGPRNLAIERQKGMISFLISAGAEAPAMPVANQMLVAASTPDPHDPIVGGVRLERLEEAIRVHGGYVSMKQTTQDCAECMIRLPAIEARGESGRTVRDKGGATHV